jgi:hypothetical protein
LNSPPPLFSFKPPPLIPRIVSTGLIFHLHTCVHSICTIFILLHPHILPPPTGTSPPVVWFCKRKKRWHLCLFQITIQRQRVSSWYFHVYMYYSLNWFINSIFFYISPLLMKNMKSYMIGIYYISSLFSEMIFFLA